MAEDVETTGDGTGQETVNAEKTYTKAEVASMIQDRLDRFSRSLEAKRKKEQEEADVKALAEKEEYKTLAEKHESRLKELEPEAERAKRYADTLAALLEAEMKAVPEYVKELLKDKDPADALGWISRHRSDFAKPNAPNINGSERGAPERTSGAKDYIKRTYGSKK